MVLQVLDLSRLIDLLEMVEKFDYLSAEVFVEELPILIDHELFDRMLVLVHDDFICDFLVDLDVLGTLAWTLLLK